MATKEEIIRKNKEHSQKYRRIAKFLLGNGLKTKEATCYNTRITYFRGELKILFVFIFFFKETIFLK